MLKPKDLSESLVVLFKQMKCSQRLPDGMHASVSPGLSAKDGTTRDRRTVPEGRHFSEPPLQTPQRPDHAPRWQPPG